MLLDKTLILKVLKEIKKEIKSKYRVKAIGLFGSYVKDMQNDSSDIDFLVEFEKGADLFHFMGLIFFLEEKFNRKVDVISKPALKEDLRENILQEVIYE
ncbi:MAG: nucleotidyltransferase [Promethearchaeota archaeon Loki_b31]|nr:MAG: nucleotidyltransferase [Candidatus Lokiarchaeota archaeon Loki_b31]